MNAVEGGVLTIMAFLRCLFSIDGDGGFAGGWKAH